MWNVCTCIYIVSTGFRGWHRDTDAGLRDICRPSDAWDYMDDGSPCPEDGDFFDATPDAAETHVYNMSIQYILSYVHCTYMYMFLISVVMFCPDGLKSSSNSAVSCCWWCLDYLWVEWESELCRAFMCTVHNTYIIQTCTYMSYVASHAWVVCQLKRLVPGRRLLRRICFCTELRLTSIARLIWPDGKWSVVGKLYRSVCTMSIHILTYMAVYVPCTCMYIVHTYIHTYVHVYNMNIHIHVGM